MATTIPRTGYAPVNGLQMYYEIHGTGDPLILIHGGFGTVGMFYPLLPALAAGRQVIGVELQAHGHTADTDRPFQLEQFGDDIAALIKHLGFEQADVLGYSLGGGAALQTAIRHPEVVRKLVVVSAPYKRNGWFPEVLAGMGQINADAMTGTFIHEAYVNVAPRPEDFPRLANKTRQLLYTDYDWTEGVVAIQAPTLIILGDADSVPPAHAAELFALLGGGLRDAGWDGSARPPSQLAILPGTTHYNILTRADLLLPVLVSFLEAV
ncbi:MAG: alpha/beta hydrolase [Chloroflexi bacterium]|nr:MAG: alpha/beta hydrolase [Chloroflexota bacterium]